MITAHFNQELSRALSSARGKGLTIGFVPTMGALHAGHLKLVERAKQISDFVVVSIFVNPAQFGANEDFDRYPRTLDADAKLLASAEVDVVFAPSVQEIYPSGVQLEAPSAPAAASRFEGESRPGHFNGMLLVVNRLLDLVEPDFAFFGQKDAQQVALVTQLIADRNARGRHHCDLVVVETVREPSGLAMSSRNRFLSNEQLPIAQSLIRALFAGATLPTREQILERAKAEIHPEAKLEYLELVDPISFEPTEVNKNSALLIVAAKVGNVRLLDNVIIDRKS